MTSFFHRFLLMLLLGVSHPLRAQSYSAGLPLFDGATNLGDVQVDIEGEEVRSIDRASLIELFRGYLGEDTIRAVEALPEKLTPAQIPFPLVFNPSELRLETKIDLKLRATKRTDLGIDLSEEQKVALAPAPVGGAVNYRLEQNWGDKRLAGKFFSGQFNSFLNIHSVVLENQSFYQSNLDQRWFRGDTRLVKDFQRSDIRLQAGDVYPQVQGFMVARPLGGMNLQRNFSLNPYRLPYPTGHQSFTLRARSFVRYFVNSVLVKSEYLQPGNYKAQDIPLNNGLNTITIEATDDLGQKQVFVFRSSSNINLLNEGESRFDLSYGIPFLDTNFKREYQDRDGKVFSGFFQYGLSSLFSSSAYLQNQADFSLYGTELIRAIPIGNLQAGLARSNLQGQEGNAGSLGYQLITQGKKWFDSHTVSLRFENRGQEFKTSALDTSSLVQNAYAANYTIPVSNRLTFSLGGNYGNVRDNDLENRYGVDVNLGLRIMNQHNLTFYVSRNRDELRRWNETAYAFLTFSLPESNSYASALYDQTQKSTRINVLRDNQNRLYNFRTQAIADVSEERRAGELDLLYPTPVGDLGAQLSGNRTDSLGTAGRGSLRLNSALVFAYQEGEVGGGISRPIPGSFVIFKPEERLRDQRIGLKSTSPYTEAETGLFNEIVFSNLIAYQYREIQLDPTFLDEGRSLRQEKFVLYPTYRSAHLIKLEERGAVILTGRLVGSDGTPLGLQVGTIGDVSFFTNRDGAIFIEGVEPGSYRLSLEGREEAAQVRVLRDERGMKDLGTIVIKENEL